MYIAVDGDSIGNQIERCMIEQNEELLVSFSNAVVDGLEVIRDYLAGNNYRIILFAGDSLLAEGPECDYEQLHTLCIMNSISFSVGIGQTMFDAYMALKYAKVSGKSKIVISVKSGLADWLELKKGRGEKDVFQ
jgi:hypothetical protein